MKKTSVLIMAILMVSLLLSTQPHLFTSQEHGPRHCKGLDVLFFGTATLAWQGLKTGEIDLIAFTEWSRALPIYDSDELWLEMFEEAKNNPDIQVAGIDANDMFEFDINNNASIPDYPGIRNPCNELSLRQAIAHAVDKGFIVNTIKQGFGERIDQPIPAPQVGWCNQNVIGPNYPYPFDMELAASCLFGELVPVCADETYVASTWINIEEEQEVHVKSGVVIDMATGGALVPCEPTVLPVGTVLHVEEEAVIHFSDTARFTFRWCDWPRWTWVEVPVCEDNVYVASTYFWLERASRLHVKSGVVRVVNTGEVLTPCTIYKLPKDATLHVEEEATVHVVSGKARFGFTPSPPPPTLVYPFPYRFERPWHYLNGLFPVGEDGNRFHDINGNGVKDVDEDLAIKVCIRADDGHRLEAGRYLCDQLRALEIPVNQIEAPKEVLNPIVMEDRNYHIYTGGWVAKRFPYYLFELFQSRFWYQWGSNYVTGQDCYGDPNYPDLDHALEELYCAPNVTAAQDACQRVCGLLAEYCINIPLWSTRSWMAFRKHLVGVVNMEGYGIVNDYTFLHAYKIDNPDTPQDESQEPIRVGTVNSPTSLNVLYSSWLSDWTVLDRIYTSLLSIQPYEPEVIQPWVAQDWQEGFWHNDQTGEWCTKVTYYIREDVGIAAPVTGEFVRNYTAHDVEFTIWYTYAYNDGWHWPAVMNVHHTCVVDDYTIEVYLNTTSIWATHWIGLQMPLLPKNELLPLLCEERMVEFHIDELIPPCTKLPLPTDDQIIQVINATKYPEDIPLEECRDFQIIAHDDGHNWFHWKNETLELVPCQTIQIWYWTPTVDPHGYYLAQPTLSWEDTFYSIGTHYPIAIVEGAGGYCTLECNPHFFLETPPKGEIDWIWYWTIGHRPRHGSFLVTIHDAWFIVNAYGSRGDGTPSSNWFPGADIDQFSPCWVTIYDATQVVADLDQVGVTGDLEIANFYSQADAFAALTSCEVDFMQDPLTSPQYTAVVGNPKIQVAPCTTDVGVDYYGYKKHLVGVVSMDNQGLENSYTFLHAYKIDDPDTPVDEAFHSIIMGTSSQPSSLNILYASTPSDWAVMDRIYTSLLSIQPYRSEVQPWVAQDWEVDTWFNDQTGEWCTKVTYYIRKDVGMVASSWPQAGEFVRYYTAHDVEFTIWYIYASADSVHWNLVSDIHHTKVVDDYTIEVYLNTTSEEAYKEIGLQMPLLGNELVGDLDLGWLGLDGSIGPYYPAYVSHSRAILFRNPYFFLESTPVGEIDWMWTWDTYPTPGPEVPGCDGGYYQVFLYDAVRVGTAYGSRGDGTPSFNWFPGADIDSNWDYACWVFLFDAVEVSGQYGTKFGRPPDP